MRPSLSLRKLALSRPGLSKEGACFGDSALFHASWSLGGRFTLEQIQLPRPNYSGGAGETPALDP